MIVGRGRRLGAVEDVVGPGRSAPAGRRAGSWRVAVSIAVAVVLVVVGLVGVGVAAWRAGGWLALSPVAVAVLGAVASGGWTYARSVRASKAAAACRWCGR